MSRRRPGCLVFMLSGGMFRRSSSPEPETSGSVPATIVAIPPSLTIPQGSSRQLVVAVLDQDGVLLSGVPVAFATSDSARATISAAGVVRAVGSAGEVTVTATCGGAAASIRVIVTSVPRSNVAPPDAPSAKGAMSQVTSAAVTGEAPMPHHSSDVAARVTLPFAYDVAVSRTGVVYVAQINGGLWRGDLPRFDLASIAAGSMGAASVVFNSAGTTAYVAGLHGPLTVVDVASNTVTATIGSGTVIGTPSAVAVGDGVLVLGVGGAAYTIDIPAGAVSPQIAVPGGVDHLSAHRTQPLFYASASSAEQVLEINVRSQAVVRSFAVGGTPHATVVSKDGRTLYVANADGNLDVVDLASGAVTAVALGPGGGFGMAMSPDSALLCVTSPRAAVVRVVDVGSLSVIRTIDVGGEPRGVAFSPDGHTVTVANESGWVDFIQ